MEEDRIESIRRNGMAISMTDEDWDELESFLDDVCQGFSLPCVPAIRI